MGECGCAAYDGMFRFPGPRGITYVLEIYTSCRECDTPVSIRLYAMNKENQRIWDVDSLPLVEIDKDEGTCVPILHPEDLIKQMQSHLFDDDEDGRDECRDSVDDSFRDAVLEGYQKTYKMFRQPEKVEVSK